MKTKENGQTGPIFTVLQTLLRAVTGQSRYYQYLRQFYRQTLVSVLLYRKLPLPIDKRATASLASSVGSIELRETHSVSSLDPFGLLEGLVSVVDDAFRVQLQSGKLPVVALLCTVVSVIRFTFCSTLASTFPSAGSTRFQPVLRGGQGSSSDLGLHQFRAIFSFSFFSPPCKFIVTMGYGDNQRRPSAAVRNSHKRGDVFKNIVKEVKDALGKPTSQGN